jgi:hypothetical protein
MAETKENRTNREQETRNNFVRRQKWQSADGLPIPNQEPGWAYRWVRLSMGGQVDAKNVSSKFREGWEPVRASDHPEIFTLPGENDRFKDNIVVGGLMLCKTPVEFVKDRNAHFKGITDSQMQAVDNSLMRENDPRMPLFNERKSKVVFGKGE